VGNFAGPRNLGGSFLSPLLFFRLGLEVRLPAFRYTTTPPLPIKVIAFTSCRSFPPPPETHFVPSNSRYAPFHREQGTPLSPSPPPIRISRFGLWLVFCGVVNPHLLANTDLSLERCIRSPPSSLQKGGDIHRKSRDFIFFRFFPGEQ